MIIYIFFQNLHLWIYKIYKGVSIFTNLQNTRTNLQGCINYTLLMHFDFSLSLTSEALKAQLRSRELKFAHVSYIYILLAMYIYSSHELYFTKHYYEWAKWTKFLLAIMYGSPRRYLNGSITLKKRKNWK